MKVIASLLVLGVLIVGVSTWFPLRSVHQSQKAAELAIRDVGEPEIIMDATPAADARQSVTSSEVLASEPISSTETNQFADESVAPNFNEVVDDESLALKYSDAVTTDLIYAYKSYERQRNAESARLVKEVMENGMYTEKFYAEGEQAPDFPSGADGKPVTMAFRIDTVSGGSLLKSANLSEPGLNPKLRALELEAHWLHNRLHALHACTCSGN